MKTSNIQRSQNSSSSSSCQSNNLRWQCQPSGYDGNPAISSHDVQNHHQSNINNYSSTSNSINNNGNRQRKNVISCVSVGDSDNEDRHCTPKQNVSDSKHLVPKRNFLQRHCTLATGSPCADSSHQNQQIQSQQQVCISH